MDWTTLFCDYLATPTAFWPEGQVLQARKLEEFLGRHGAEAGRARKALAETIIASARDRASGPGALFLVNCGSSGSHWLEIMLAALPGIRACGEVYLPPRATELLAAAGADQRRAFLDALHQVHMATPPPAAVDDVLINSAHSWGPGDFMGAGATTILLVRDPVDVVLSRTFRKPRLRRHVDPRSSDAEYLERNIAFVTKFYRSALRRKPQHRVRYEEMRDDAAGTLGKLARLLGREASQARLDEIARRFSAEGQASSGRRLSNVHQGSRATPDAWAEFAAERLDAVRRELGYA